MFFCGRSALPRSPQRVAAMPPFDRRSFPPNRGSALGAPISQIATVLQADRRKRQVPLCLCIAVRPHTNGAQLGPALAHSRSRSKATAVASQPCAGPLSMRGGEKSTERFNIEAGKASQGGCMLSFDCLALRNAQCAPQARQISSIGVRQSQTEAQTRFIAIRRNANGQVDIKQRDCSWWWRCRK